MHARYEAYHAWLYFPLQLLPTEWSVKLSPSSQNTKIVILDGLYNNIWTKRISEKRIPQNEVHPSAVQLGYVQRVNLTL